MKKRLYHKNVFISNSGWNLEVTQNSYCYSTYSLMFGVDVGLVIVTQKIKRKKNNLVFLLNSTHFGSNFEVTKKIPFCQTMYNLMFWVCFGAYGENKFKLSSNAPRYIEIMLIKGYFDLSVVLSLGHLLTAQRRFKPAWNTLIIYMLSIFKY